MAKQFHFVILVDDENNISLGHSSLTARFQDGNVYNLETEEWEEGTLNENEERDSALCEHLKNVFENHNELFGDGQELSVS